MKSLNLGILAHVDAGKTSLTERLLYAAGVIDEIGSVDAGNTQTDSLALERQRGITIKSAVASFVVGDTHINLIDTPGHPDFIAEVERVLSVLDGVVLVISAVEGVQAQTRVLMRALQRLHIPTLLFVNKIDRAGARYEGVLEEIADKLTPGFVAMGETHALGTPSANFTAYAMDDAHSTKLAEQTKQGQAHPVFFGSAITGAGIEAITTAITTLLPPDSGKADGPASGRVFKIERGQAGEKIAYVRMVSGRLSVRERVPVGEDKENKVTAVSVYEHGSTIRRTAITAGEIGKLWGLGDAQIGDTLGAVGPATNQHQFAPPTLETVISPLSSTDKSTLRTALEQLAEQDPLINLRQDDTRQEIYLSLYGEVQKEVIQATLANDFGIAVAFRTTTAICVERLLGSGAAVESGVRGDPFLATVGLRITPGAVNSGAKFVIAHDTLGRMPLAFYKAVEDTVMETLCQGLQGWQVTDCLVTMTHADFFPRQSHAHARFDKSMSSTGADFRGLTPLVLMNALRQAGTVVCEPVHRFELEIPKTALNTLLPILAQLQATPETTVLQGTRYALTGGIPAARIHELQRQLPALTGGEGVLECTFDRYEPVRGAPPSRPRTDFNPLNRKEYMLHIVKRA